MTKEQAEVFNTIQDVLKGVVLAIAASDPAKTADVQSTLANFAEHPGLDKLASRMLKDLAEGVGLVASATHRVQ